MFVSLILRHVSERLPGRYFEPFFLATTPSSRSSFAAAVNALPSPSTWVISWSRWSSSTISSRSSRRSSSVRPVVSRPSSHSTSKTTSATGISFAARLISRSFARFIRCCSASNELRPSASNATISPSSTAFT